MQITNRKSIEDPTLEIEQESIGRNQSLDLKKDRKNLILRKNIEVKKGLGKDQEKKKQKEDDQDREIGRQKIIRREIASGIRRETASEIRREIASGIRREITLEAKKEIVSETKKEIVLETKKETIDLIKKKLMIRALNPPYLQETGEVITIQQMIKIMNLLEVEMLMKENNKVV